MFPLGRPHLTLGDLNLHPNNLLYVLILLCVHILNLIPVREPNLVQLLPLVGDLPLEHVYLPLLLSHVIVLLLEVVLLVLVRLQGFEGGDCDECSLPALPL